MFWSSAQGTYFTFSFFSLTFREGISFYISTFSSSIVRGMAIVIILHELYVVPYLFLFTLKHEAGYFFWQGLIIAEDEFALQYDEQ